jgi:formyltetrahydrofolate hydrolase
MQSEPTYTLTIACPDRIGIVAAVSRFIADRGGWIVEANHHADQATQRLFMRNVLRARCRASAKSSRRSRPSSRWTGRSRIRPSASAW